MQAGIPCPLRFLITPRPRTALACRLNQIEDFEQGMPHGMDLANI